MDEETIRARLRYDSGTGPGQHYNRQAHEDIYHLLRVIDELRDQLEDHGIVPLPLSYPVMPRPVVQQS